MYRAAAACERQKSRFNGQSKDEGSCPKGLHAALSRPEAIYRNNFTTFCKYQ